MCIWARGCHVPPLKGIVYIPKDGKTLGSTGFFQGEVSVASTYNSQGMSPRLLPCRPDPGHTEQHLVLAGSLRALGMGLWAVTAAMTLITPSETGLLPDEKGKL